MSLPYVLNARQLIAFEHKFSLWKPPVKTAGANKRANDPVYDMFPTYAQIPGRLQSTPFATRIDPVLGRVNENTVLVLDIGRFHSQQEIADSWLVRLDKPGHPQNGQFWRVEGGKKVRESGRRPIQEATVKMFITAQPIFKGTIALTVGQSMDSVLAAVPWHYQSITGQQDGSTIVAWNGGWSLTFDNQQHLVSGDSLPTFVVIS